MTCDCTYAQNGVEGVTLRHGTLLRRDPNAVEPSDPDLRENSSRTRRVPVQHAIVTSNVVAVRSPLKRAKATLIEVAARALGKLDRQEPVGVCDVVKKVDEGAAVGGNHGAHGNLSLNKPTGR